MPTYGTAYVFSMCFGPVCYARLDSYRSVTAKLFLNLNMMMAVLAYIWGDVSKMISSKDKEYKVNILYCK